MATNGPIPASAGEPLVVERGELAQGAYPRERGGTTTIDSLAAGDLGLSPRARGNREAHGGRVRVQGPIPASAGEPD